MVDLTKLEKTELVDMLVRYMDEYYLLAHDLNNSERFFQCYDNVKAVQGEIAKRNREE